MRPIPPAKPLGSRCAPGALLLVILAALEPSVAAAKGLPLTLDDLAMVRRVSSPRLAPDGRQVAFVSARQDFAADRAISEVKLAEVANGRGVTVGSGATPAWSPDGTLLAYEGEEEERSWIFLYDLATKQSRKLVETFPSAHFLGHEADKGFAFSPDGKQIAFCSPEPPPPAPAGTAVPPAAAGAPGPATATGSGITVITRILYKTRIGLSDNRPTHLWVVAIDGPEAGKPRLLTPGANDEHSLTWAPDGKAIAFVSNRSADPDANYSDDLWRVEVASGALTRLTTTPGTELHPAWSPDGSRIAYLATRREVSTKDSAAEDPHLYVLPAAGGASRELAPDLDRRVASLLWHPDGKSVFVAVDDNGKVPILRVPVPPVEKGAVAAAPGRVERFLDGFSVQAEPSLDRAATTLAYVRSELTRPPEIWVKTLEGGRSHQVSQENRTFLGKVELANADNLYFPSFDGTRTQLFLFRPAGFKPGQKYPLVMWVHGGPHGMFSFTYTERLQVLAANGFGVLAVNPRGSTGYGQKISDGTLGQWGGDDYKDLMAALDWVTSTYSWIDKDRLGVAGWSYGGFMTNWVITQTDRFKAAMAGASLSNLVSFYGTSLYQDLIETEFGGKPWEGDNFAKLWKWSPLAYVARVKTPTLFLHGEADQDVPITQAEEMYTALRQQGIAATLVRYAGEGHGFRKPSHIRDMYQRILDWFGGYLHPTPPAARPADAPPPPAQPPSAEPPAAPPAPPAGEATQ